VVDVVVSPGSRSTPLVLALAAEPELRCHAVVDERSAAFFALGQARATGRPSALVCTSGTAGAHYLPAVVEAHASGLPLVVVTADRPWEAHDCGASQTIDQLKLFGTFVRHFGDVGHPDPSPAAMRALARAVAQAVSVALGPHPGPTHLNLRFRKPLEPVDAPAFEPWQGALDAIADRGAARVIAPRLEPARRAVDELVERCGRAERGLVVCGPAPAHGDLDALRAAVGELARRTGFPVLAEATSQLRFGSLGPGVVACGPFDPLLRSRAVRERLAPDLVIELGAPATSTGWALLLEQHRSAARYVIAPHGFADPDGSATALVRAEPAALCGAVAERLPGRARHSEWRAAWARLDALAARLVDRALDDGAFSEGLVTRRVVDAIPDGALLAVGNSLPVRHLDAYARRERPLPVLHQRGASGIDGLVAGTAGAATSAARPAALLIGDVSFLYDLSSLALAAQVRTPLVVFVVNNGGGRIFEQLPIVDVPGIEPEIVEHATTPHDTDFASAAKQYGVRYALPTSLAEVGVALDEAYAHAGCTLIEVKVASSGAIALARSVAAAIEAAVAPLVNGPRP
jgi:2-succinyl-5-enolpyruvyl-6-hydroxy-3-cyclohexene-1-carboxylate synthase